MFLYCGATYILWAKSSTSFAPLLAQCILKHFPRSWLENCSTIMKNILSIASDEKHV